MYHNIQLFWEGNKRLCEIKYPTTRKYKINQKHISKPKKKDSPIFKLYSLTFRTKAVFFLKSYILLMKVGILMQLFKTLIYSLIFL